MDTAGASLHFLRVHQIAVSPTIRPCYNRTMSKTLRRLLPAVVAFLLTVAALVPSAQTLPENGDESHYAWNAGYYGGKLSRLDFRREGGADPWTDPGWDPLSAWSLTQPMGTRYTYALALAVTGKRANAVALRQLRPREEQPDAAVPPDTLLVLRLTSVLCAALAFAAFAYLWRWRALLATALLLALPFVRADLALARAESQQLLGFALVALAWRSPWFPVACGLAASFKLTGLMFWPLLLWPAASGNWRRLPVLGPPLAALAVWTLTEPPAWYATPVLQLAFMLAHRGISFGAESGYSPILFGLYLPSRYLLLFAYLCAFAAVHPSGLRRLWRRAP